MTDYRRIHIPGATWFFTVNLAERKGNGLLLEHIDTLRLAFIRVRRRHAFQMEAVVVLPDHLHCIWTLPPGDDGYSARWGLSKYPPAEPGALVREPLEAAERGR